MGVDHHLIRQFTLFDEVDELSCVFYLITERRADFVPDAGFGIVPFATCICDVKNLAVVEVEIGFTDDAMLPVVVFGPQITIVVFG